MHAQCLLLLLELARAQALQLGVDARMHRLQARLVDLQPRQQHARLRLGARLQLLALQRSMALQVGEGLLVAAERLVRVVQRMLDRQAQRVSIVIDVGEQLLQPQRGQRVTPVPAQQAGRVEVGRQQLALVAVLARQGLVLLEQRLRLPAVRPVADHLREVAQGERLAVRVAGSPRQLERFLGVAARRRERRLGAVEVALAHGLVRHLDLAAGQVVECGEKLFVVARQLARQIERLLHVLQRQARIVEELVADADPVQRPALEAAMPAGAKTCASIATIKVWTSSCIGRC